MLKVKPEFVRHRDSNILFLNLSNMDKNDIPEFLKETETLIKGQPEESILFLVNVHKMGFDHSTIGQFIDFLKVTKKFAKATVVTGIDVVKKHLYQAAIDLSGRGSKNLKFMTDIEEAKDWLVTA